MCEAHRPPGRSGPSHPRVWLSARQGLHVARNTGVGADLPPSTDERCLHQPGGCCPPGPRSLHSIRPARARNHSCTRVYATTPAAGLPCGCPSSGQRLTRHQANHLTSRAIGGVAVTGASPQVQVVWFATLGGGLANRSRQVVQRGVSQWRRRAMPSMNALRRARAGRPVNACVITVSPNRASTSASR